MGRTLRVVRHRLGAVSGFARLRPVQFFFFGAILLWLSPDETNEIRLSTTALQRAQPPPSAPAAALSADLRKSRFIQDELLFREGLRLGLFQNDAIIRERLIQRVLFLAEAAAGTETPATPEALQAHLEAHRALFPRAVEVDLVHVFSGVGDVLLPLTPVLERWAESAVPGAVPPYGKPFGRSRRIMMRFAEIDQIYGEQFARAVGRLPLSVWSPVIRSKFGFHRIWIRQRNVGPVLLEEVEEAVRLSYDIARRQRATERFVGDLLATTPVYFEGERVRGLGTQPRTSARFVQSPED